MMCMMKNSTSTKSSKILDTTNLRSCIAAEKKQQLFFYPQINDQHIIKIANKLTKNAQRIPISKFKKKTTQTGPNQRANMHRKLKIIYNACMINFYFQFLHVWSKHAHEEMIKQQVITPMTQKQQRIKKCVKKYQQTLKSAFVPKLIFLEFVQHSKIFLNKKEKKKKQPSFSHILGNNNNTYHTYIHNIHYIYSIVFTYTPSNQLTYQFFFVCLLIFLALDNTIKLQN
eukprot:TRINITY_DN797_c1_g1_i5.p2 TRINITY_DN797_c1_g1~~TRINITY_DN797_c1_g1_i5.p2  ORF type:complete len:228 (-),score=7.38 TRINITY_DN797_c1_g1_i5:477-1160(-)